MDNLEISAELAREMIPCLETKLSMAEEKAAEATAEAARMRTALAELRAKLNGQSPLAFNGKLRKRLPKGQGAKLVFDLLQSLPPGGGLSMADIRQRTGIKHPTIYRTLTDPKRNKGRFVADGKLWKLKPK